jgi:NAD(P)-dependent dehydrogenase (short-subunit alcohol dehydrogenase family)
MTVGNLIFETIFWTAYLPFIVPVLALLGRSAETIAPAVVFLASDEAHMVSGATYDVTGGDSANYTA